MLYVFLVFVRLGTFLMYAPVFNFIRLPINVRILISVTFAFFLTYNTPSTAFISVDVLSLVIFIAHEVVNGAALTFGMITAFAVFHFAGRVLDFQMGFGVAGLIDPATQIQAPMIGTVLNLLASIVFIVSGGMGLVIKTLALSIRHIPVGTMFNLQTPEWFLIQAGLIFSLSITLISPIMITIFMLDIVMAFAGRMMPQMNVFILSIPAKIALGISILAATVVYSTPLYRKVFESLFNFWEPMLNG